MDLMLSYTSSMNTFTLDTLEQRLLLSGTDAAVDVAIAGSVFAQDGDSVLEVDAEVVGRLSHAWIAGKCRTEIFFSF